MLISPRNRRRLNETLIAYKNWLRSSSKISQVNISPEQRLEFDNLLELHRFRSASLTAVEQLVEELGYLSNSDVDQERVTQIYNEKFQSTESDDQKQIAQALKSYWQRINKWEDGSEKQRKKVMEVKSILCTAIGN